MFDIRPFEATDEAYARDVEINNALWPDELNTVENLKYDDAHRSPDYFFQRSVVILNDPSGSLEQNGKIIGLIWCGQDPWSYEPGKYYIGFHVDPAFSQLEYGKNGIGPATMSYLVNLLNSREPALRRLTTMWREDKPDRLKFLKGQGFKQVMRFQDSKLDLTAFDPTPFLEKVDLAQSYGIRLVSLSEMKTMFKDWLERVYEMEMDIGPDEPMAGEFTAQPLEEYAKAFNHPSFLEDCWFIALDGDQSVGVSNIWNNKANPQKLYTGFTGVRRTHRRRGIAIALKLRAIEAAQKRGATSLITGNEENNPMYQINLKLGFKPRPGWLEFHKTLEADD